MVFNSLNFSSLLVVLLNDVFTFYFPEGDDPFPLAVCQ